MREPFSMGQNKCGIITIVVDSIWGPKVRIVLWLQESLEPGPGMVGGVFLPLSSSLLSAASTSLVHLSGNKAATRGRGLPAAAQRTQRLASHSQPPLLPGPAWIRFSPLDLQTLTRGKGVTPGKAVISWKAKKMDCSNQMPKRKNPRILQKETQKRRKAELWVDWCSFQTPRMKAAGAWWVCRRVGRSG